LNLPNQGHISNLPEGAIVEVPGLISGAGVQGVAVGPLLCAWKAEVDVYSEDVVLARASELEVDWPVIHGACTNVRARYDPTDAARIADG
jgi:hypothetical protein